MTNRIAIDVDFVRSRFEYDPIGGYIGFKGSGDQVELRQLNTGNVALRVRDLPGYEDRKNAVELVGGRLAWALHTGEDPGEFEITYKNHDKTDLRFDNLEKTTEVGRANNRQRDRGIKLGKNNQYLPSVQHKGVHRSLRRCNTLQEARDLISNCKEVIKAAARDGQDTMEAFLAYCKEHTYRKGVVESAPETTDEDANESV